GSRSFVSLSGAAATLVKSSVYALEYLKAAEGKPKNGGRRLAPHNGRTKPRQRLPSKRGGKNPSPWNPRNNNAGWGRRYELVFCPIPRIQRGCGAVPHTL